MIPLHVRFPPATYTNHSAALRRAAVDPLYAPYKLTLLKAANALDVAALDLSTDQSDANVGTALLVWDAVREIYKHATGKDFPMD